MPQKYFPKTNPEAEIVVNFALRRDLSIRATEIYLEYITKSDSIWKTACDLIDAVFWNKENEIPGLSDELYKRCCQIPLT